MPTGDQYRQAAEALGAVADEIGESFGHVDRPWDDAVQGGLLAETVTTVIETSKGLTTSITGHLRIVADECHRRAGVCDDFDAELRRHYLEMSNYAVAESNRQPGDPPSPSPTRPYPSEPWITPSV